MANRLIKDWMTPNPETLQEGDPVRAAVDLMIKRRFRHIPVIKDGRLEGFLTDRDVRRALPSVAAGATPEARKKFMNETTLGQLMTRRVLTCAPDTDIAEAVRIFNDERIGALPVMDGDRLVGIVSQTDMMRAFLQFLQEAQAL